MPDDIVTRLRNAAVGLPQDDMNQAAADEIERLRAVVAEIDALHTPFTDEGDQSCHECVGAWPCRTYSRLHQEEARRG